MRIESRLNGEGQANPHAKRYMTCPRLASSNHKSAVLPKDRPPDMCLRPVPLPAISCCRSGRSKKVGVSAVLPHEGECKSGQYILELEVSRQERLKEEQRLDLASLVKSHVESKDRGKKSSESGGQDVASEKESKQFLSQYGSRRGQNRFMRASERVKRRCKELSLMRNIERKQRHLRKGTENSAGHPGLFCLSEEHNSELCRITGLRSVSPVQCGGNKQDPLSHTEQRSQRVPRARGMRPRNASRDHERPLKKSPKFPAKSEVLYKISSYLKEPAAPPLQSLRTAKVETIFGPNASQDAGLNAVSCFGYMLDSKANDHTRHEYDYSFLTQVQGVSENNKQRQGNGIRSREWELETRTYDCQRPTPGFTEVATELEVAHTHNRGSVLVQPQGEGGERLPRSPTSASNLQRQSPSPLQSPSQLLASSKPVTQFPGNSCQDEQMNQNEAGNANQQPRHNSNAKLNLNLNLNLNANSNSNSQSKSKSKSKPKSKSRLRSKPRLKAQAKPSARSSVRSISSHRWLAHLFPKGNGHRNWPARTSSIHVDSLASFPAHNCSHSLMKSETTKATESQSTPKPESGSYTSVQDRSHAEAEGKLKGKAKEVSVTLSQREIKKQILCELMELNNLQPIYFLLGRQPAHCAVDLNIDQVVDMVDILTSQEGEIVVRPKMKEEKEGREGPLIRKFAMQTAPGCQEAISISRAPVQGRIKDTALRHTAISGHDYSKGQNRSQSQSNSNGNCNCNASSNNTSNNQHQNQSQNQSKSKSIGKLKLRPKQDPHIATTTSLKPAEPGSGSSVGAGQSKPLASNHKWVQSIDSIKPPLLTNCKIKIWHQPDYHHIHHPINVVIRYINDITGALFKPKDGRVDIRLVLNLCWKLNSGSIVSKSQLQQQDYLKSKDNVYAIKEKLLRILYSTINNQNLVEPLSALGYPKFYVENGNNPMMVKSVLKQRWWWTATELRGSAQLVWTQWKKPSVMAFLPCVHPTSHVAKDKSTAQTSNPPVNIPNNDLNANMHDSSTSNVKTTAKTIRMCNHLEGNGHLGNKKALYYNMKAYYKALGQDPFHAIPLTFHIGSLIGDPEYAAFVEYHNVQMKASAGTKSGSVWIVKPGEHSNRGHGIAVCRSLEEITKELSSVQAGKTKIVQQYIERPLLYNRRKFDIRCYGLVTAFNGLVKGYFYRDGYLRTSAKEFSLRNLGSRAVHLTNEAVQRNYDDFGRFEPGNKLTYADLQKYLETTAEYSGLDVDFNGQLLPQIRKLVTDSIRAVHGKLDPNGRQHTFEVFGYDFMIDEDLHLYLIEANINPCLEILSPVTARIVPAMLDSAVRIALDPIFQPPVDVSLARKSTTTDILPEIKHELVYDSILDATELDLLIPAQEETILEAEDEEASDSQAEAEVEVEVGPAEDE